MNLNKAMIIGNLTRAPEVKTTPDGTNVATFSVATNFVWNSPQSGRQERVEYHNIVAWRKLAEICSQYLKKGSKVYIEGRLQTRNWDDQNGTKHYRTEIVAENMIMLDRISSSGDKSQPSNSEPETIQLEDERTDPEKGIDVDNVPF